MGPSLLNTVFHKEDCNLEITSNSTLYKGDNLTLRLTDLNGTPIPDANVNVTILNEEGSDEYNVITDSNGMGYLKFDKIVGKYTANCTFNGNGNFNPAHAIQRIEITVDKAQPVYQVLNQSFNSSMNSTIYYDGNLNVYYGNNSVPQADDQSGYISV